MAMEGKGDLWRVWAHEQERCEQAIVRGESVEVMQTSYGENDFILHFLRDSGLWAVLAGMEADGLKRGNGKSPVNLNGVEMIRELAGVDRIQRCGKVLRDTRLMLEAGFNLEEIAKAKSKQKGVIDPETLSNHLARISLEAAQAAFIEHVRLLRSRRWIRGSVYAADAHEIIVPYGRQYERLGKINQKYGFKLVLLINIAEERERIVGFKLAPLQTSEKRMLSEILRQLDEEVAPLNKWMKVLILDRGYWGAEYLTGLKKRYKLDLVTRAKNEELDAVEWIKTSLSDAKWREYEEERSRLGRIKVRVAGVEDVPLYESKHRKLAGHVNAVVADEFDLKGKPLVDDNGETRPRFYYITTLPLKRGPYSIRRHYLKRWVIENQGFRELTVRWKLDTLVGKRFYANHARLAFVFMLYNAERILRMKHPGPWQEEKKKLSNMGERGLLGGPALAAYTPEAQLGLLSVQRYRELVQLAERRRIAGLLRDCLEKGSEIDSLLEDLEG
jgi:hypothetical protein